MSPFDDKGLSDAFKFLKPKISDVFNFGRAVVRNKKRPKLLVINVLTFYKNTSFFAELQYS